MSAFNLWAHLNAQGSHIIIKEVAGKKNWDNFWGLQQFPLVLCNLVLDEACNSHRLDAQCRSCVPLLVLVEIYPIFVLLNPCSRKLTPSHFPPIIHNDYYMQIFPISPKILILIYLNHITN